MQGWQTICTPVRSAQVAPLADVRLCCTAQISQFPGHVKPTNQPHAEYKLVEGDKSEATEINVVDVLEGTAAGVLVGTVLALARAEFAIAFAEGRPLAQS